MSTDLSILRRQRVTVLNGMSNSRDQISHLSDKITRLQKVSNSLQTNITYLEASKRTIDSLTIDNNRWKGTNESKFINRYSSYQESVKDFIQKTVTAKERIDDEINRAEVSKMGYANGLNNLQSSLTSVENQIRLAEREGEW